MNPLPWTAESVDDRLQTVLHGVLFTLGVSVVVVASALLIQTTIAVSRAYTGSAGASSLLAIAVFAACIGGPLYLLATRISVDRSDHDDGNREKL